MLQKNDERLFPFDQNGYIFKNYLLPNKNALNSNCSFLYYSFEKSFIMYRIKRSL